MYIQAWNMDNGRPSLFTSEGDIPSNFTRNVPPDGLFDPVYYDQDNNVWVGSEPPIIEQPEPETIPEPVENETEELIAQLILENTLMQFSIKSASDRINTLETLVTELIPKGEPEEKTPEEDTPTEETNKEEVIKEEDTNGDTLS